MFFGNKAITANLQDRPLIRLFKKQNIDNFKHAVNVFDWSDLFTGQDVDAAYNMFSDNITEIFCNNFQLVRASRKFITNVKPWITPSLIKCINTNVKCTRNGCRLNNQ